MTLFCIHEMRLYIFDLYMVWFICDSEYFVFLECTIEGKYYFVNDK